MSRASDRYDRENEQRFREEMRRQLSQRPRRLEPVLLRSPGGKVFELRVDDLGALSTVPATT